jgi:hypothetical protein
VNPDFWTQALTILGAGVTSGVGAWGAIRYELGFVKATAESAKESASEAHSRIDSLLIGKK